MELLEKGEIREFLKKGRFRRATPGNGADIAELPKEHKKGGGSLSCPRSVTKKAGFTGGGKGKR